MAASFVGCGDEDAPPASGSLPPAPAGVERGCSEAADVARVPVLCPTRWPASTHPARARLRLMGSDDAYLLEAQEGFGGRAAVFHVLFGGQLEPFPPGFERAGRQLRVTTRRVTTPVHEGGKPTGREFVVEAPTRVVGATRIHGHPAAILRAPPYPRGGIHGGHSIVMWNEDGHGYLVSAHGATSRRAATRAAIEVARSTR